MEISITSVPNLCSVTCVHVNTLNSMVESLFKYEKEKFCNCKER